MAVNLCLVLVSFSLSLLFAEGIFRQYWQPACLYMKKASALYQYDELLGWKLAANKMVERKSSEYRVIEKTNSQGLRCPEVPLKKGESEFRILFLGDSFAQAYTVEWDKTYAAVTGDLVSKKLGHKVSIINGGCAGWSTDQQLLWYQHYGKKWKADLVVLLFFDNDLWYNTQHRYWRGFKPKFGFRKGQLHLVYKPARPLQWKHSSFFSHSYIALYFHEKLTQFGFRLPKVASVPDFSIEFNRYIVSHEQTKKGWLLTKALLQELAKEVKSVGSSFLFFLVPNRWSVDTQLKKALIKRYGVKANAWDVNSIARKIPKVCEQLEIECIEPTARFKRSKEKLYLPRDGHWNVAGHHLAGTIIAEHVKNEHQ